MSGDGDREKLVLATAAIRKRVTELSDEGVSLSDLASVLLLAAADVSIMGLGVPRDDFMSAAGSAYDGANMMVSEFITKMATAAVSTGAGEPS